MSRYRFYSRAASDYGDSDDFNETRPRTPSIPNSPSGFTPIQTFSARGDSNALRFFNDATAVHTYAAISARPEQGIRESSRLSQDADSEYVGKSGCDEMVAFDQPAKLGEMNIPPMSPMFLNNDLPKPNIGDQPAPLDAIGNDLTSPGYRYSLLTNGVKALHDAMEAGRADIIEALVGVDNNILLKSIQRCEEHHDHQSVTVKGVRALLECGANIDARNEDDGDTVLHIAARNGCIAVFDLLTEYPGLSLLGTKNDADRTPLHIAVYNGRENIAKLLIANGASTEDIDADGNTALHLASRRGMAKTLEALLERHAECDRLLSLSNNEGMTPLHCAAVGLHTDALRLLLERDDPKRVTQTERAPHGGTALHWATWYQNLDLIKRLIMNGADVSVMDENNCTAFNVAEELGTCSKEILKWLTRDTPDNLDNAHTSSFPLKRPVSGAKDLCEATKIYLMDVYPQAQMEKAHFTVSDIVYEWGPSPLMTARAMAEKIQGKLSFRWIHLHKNSKIWIKDLLQTIYFDKTESAKSESLRFKPPSSDLGDLVGSKRGLKGDGENANEMQHGSEQLKTKGFQLPSMAEATEQGKGDIDWGQETGKPVVEGQHTRATAALGGKPNPKKVHHYPHLRQFVDNFLGRTAGVQPFHFMVPLVEGFEERTNLPRGRSKYRLALSIPYFSFRKVSEIDGSPRVTQPNTVQNTDYTEDTTEHDTESKRLPESYVHHSLTLDEFYYKFMKNANDRNVDQVLYRHHKRITLPTQQHEGLICMVNQCWLLIADDETIVTSTSEQEDGGYTTIQGDISKHFSEKDKRPQVSSALDMIPLIVSHCCRRTFELRLPLDIGGENLLQVFGSSIARAAEQEVDLFQEFKRSLEAENCPSFTSQDSQNGGILEEIKLLMEVKDILDELNIIRTVLLEQRKVLDEAFDTLNDLDRRVRHETDDRYRHDRRRIDKPEDPRELLVYYQRFSKLEMIEKEVAKLVHDAEETRKNINHLLDLRQKHANLTEAISARTSSENTARQGKTILVFTVVTIVFLPITFLSSLFALNITSFPHDKAGALSYSPQWAYSRLFGITFAVSVPLITLAFFMDHIGDFVSSSLPTKTKGERTDARKDVTSTSANPDVITEEPRQGRICRIRRRGRPKPGDEENMNSKPLNGHTTAG